MPSRRIARSASLRATRLGRTAIVMVAAAALLAQLQPASAEGALPPWLAPLLHPLSFLRPGGSSAAAAPRAAAVPTTSSPELDQRPPPAPSAVELDRPAAATALAVGSAAGWRAFDLSNGAQLPAARVPSGKRAWSAGNVRVGPGGAELLLATFFGDPFSTRNFKGAIEALRTSGSGNLRRFSKLHPNFDLRRPADLAWVDAAVPSALGGGGGGVRRQLIVAAVGNDALPAYDAETGRLLYVLARGDNTTASMQAGLWRTSPSASP
jgi:hypothetical protein